MKKLLILALVAATPVLASDRVAAYDFDKDGKVSFQDLNRYCDVSEKLFKLADKNGDGFLSEAELRTARGYLFNSCANKYAKI